MTSKEQERNNKARYRARHPERAEAARKKYYADHKEKILAVNKKWAADHPERMRELIRNGARKFRAVHPEKAKEWRNQNPEKAKAASLRWRAEHPERAKELDHLASQRYRARNPEKSKADSRAWARRYRLAALAAYGGKCACCGEAETEFLCIDHVNNDGNVHRKAEGIHSIYPWLMKHEYPDGFQVLCWNCNSAKAFYGGCPHQRSAK